MELAWYAADRSDVEGAITLLRRAYVDEDDDELTYLTSLRRRVRNATGRNEPCSCGSGKKYKVCCLNVVNLSAEQRAGLLHHKLETFVLRPKTRLVFDVVVDLVGADSESVTRVAGGVLLDAVACHPTVITEFLQERGDLLPEFDRSHLELWKDVRLSLYEVTSRAAGTSLTLRQSRTGEQLLVTERTASHELTVGTFVLARVVPADALHVIVGSPLLISLAQRASLIDLLDHDPTPADLAEWLGLALGPPTLQNREGEELTMCSVTYRVPDWDQLTPTLTREFEAIGVAEWLEFVELEGERLIRATLRRDGAHLVAETNSTQRMRRMKDQLLRTSPELVVVAESQRDLDEMMAQGSAASPPGTSGPAHREADAELQHIARDYIEKKEREWVRESIPALGGLTPLEALDDPTRREDLLLLLDELGRRHASEVSSVGMNADRLRGLLGL
jgi:hypothetical protein